MRKVMLAAVVSTALALLGYNAAQSQEKGDAAAEKASAARAREVVKMLDDIYKNTIVLITDKYVNDTDDFAAGSAAVELFRRISEKGSHEVRLLDASGEPYDEDNLARDEFEKKGIEQLKAGKTYVEEIQQQDGKSVLRALTPVPVVMEKCVMCHPHYEDAKEGEPIGAISYSIPLK